MRYYSYAITDVMWPRCICAGCGQRPVRVFMPRTRFYRAYWWMICPTCCTCEAAPSSTTNGSVTQRPKLTFTDHGLSYVIALGMHTRTKRDLIRLGVLRPDIAPGVTTQVKNVPAHEWQVKEKTVWNF